MRPARYIIDKLEKKDDGPAADYVNLLVEQMADRTKLYRALIIFGGLNLLIWLGILVFPSDVSVAFAKVNDLDPKMGFIVIAFIFGIGLFFSYGAIKLIFPDVEDVRLERTPMASFGYGEQAQKRWMVWLFAVIGGVLNLLWMIIVDIGLSAS